MSQWVSVIDKIITKPKGKNPPTDDPQKQLRTLLGEAAWKYLQAEPSHPLGDITKALWERRIHPYASTKPTSKVQHETQKTILRDAGMLILWILNLTNWTRQKRTRW